jgi:hypothetical protein
MASYSRGCKKCGRRINLRKMPGGQWVAFEGFDTVHDCHSAKERSPAKPLPKKHEQNESRTEESIYDNIDFPEVMIGGVQDTSPPKNSSSDSSRISHQKETIRIPQPSIPPKTTNFWPWMFWVLVSVLILYWFISHHR